MKRLSWLTRTVLVAPLAFFVSSGAAGPPPEGLPPARKIPGLTVPDTHPKGCVDCHIRYPEHKLDERFSTLMAGWTTKVDARLLKKAQAAVPAGVTLKGKRWHGVGVRSHFSIIVGSPASQTGERGLPRGTAGRGDRERFVGPVSLPPERQEPPDGSSLVPGPGNPRSNAGS